jgi:hypothetical protein
MVSFGVGVVILIMGVVTAVLTGYWLVLVPIWSFGLLHTGLLIMSLHRYGRGPAAQGCSGNAW